MNQSTPRACAEHGHAFNATAHSDVNPEKPGATFGELARIFVDRRDVKFWQAEGPRYNYLYWVRAMLSQEIEPPPLISRIVPYPQNEVEKLRFARAREEVYGFLGRAFEYPDAALLGDITKATFVERVAGQFRQLANNDEVNAGLTLWLQAAGKDGALLGDSGLGVLREAYTKIVYDSNLPCIPPYQSVYYNEHHVNGKQARTAAACYRTAGLGIENGDMPDHIAIECEFAAFLAGKEAVAWKCDQRAVAQQAEETLTDFLREHVVSWGGKFCADLQQLAKVDFYRAVARLGAGLFNDELLRLSDA